jgi:hypothetical protein
MQKDAESTRGRANNQSKGRVSLVCRHLPTISYQYAAEPLASKKRFSHRFFA